MSTIIVHKRPVVTEDELAAAYCRLGYNTKNKHVAPWTPARFDAEYIAYVENGRRITGGFGEHRATTNRRNRIDGKYGAFSYGVVELGWV
ncbi:hypothetical protein AB4Z38_06855 [Arthrobacter sp. 2RAF6]|uniref:hypothetical protein n=1 Tax=Arthrobacter sp. 2RAF6 TaxID=3233002 RepID=UPI003F930FD9